MKRCIQAIVLLVLSFSLFPGCAATFKLVPIHGEDLAIVWVRGREAAVISNDQALVAILGWKNQQEGMAFDVYVRNTSGQSVDVRTDRIRAGYTDDKGKQEPLLVEDPYAYLERTQGEREAAGLVNAISSGLWGAAPGYSSSSNSPYAYGPGGGSSYGQSNTGSFSSLASSLEQTQYAEDPDRIDKRYTNRYQSAASGMLFSQTLAPGEWVEGIVVVNYVSATEYSITIDVGEQSYSIKFRPNED